MGVSLTDIIEKTSTTISPHPGIIGGVAQLLTPSTVASGTEVAYAQITANVVITVHTSAGATTVVTAPAFTADGVSSYLIDFYAPYVFNSNAGGETVLELYDGATELGAVGVYDHYGSNTGALMRAAARIIPTAGSHVYSIRAWTQALSQTTVTAASGGLLGVGLPTFLRITKS